MCTVHKLRGIPCNIHPAEPSVSCQKVKVQHGLEEEYSSQHRSPPFPHFLLDLVFRKIGFFSRQSFHKRSYSRLDNGRIIVVKSRISWKEIVRLLSFLVRNSFNEYSFSKVILFRLIFICDFCLCNNICFRDYVIFFRDYIYL